MRYLKVLASVAAAVFLLPNSAAAQDELSFTRDDISLGTFAAPRQSASGDFNGDGRVDLVIAAAGSVSSPAQTIMLLGNGDGSFQPARSVFTAQEPSSMIVADFNNDGRQDLAADLGDMVAIRLGNGDGTFLPALEFDVGGSVMPDAIATGDFNRDGAPDLAISVNDLDSGESNVRIYLGNGDGTFSRCKAIVQGNPRALAVGDFNGDGEQDLAAIDFTIEDNRVRNRVLILVGQGDGNFEPVSQETVVGPEAQALTVGDFNSDGRQDVATADPNTDVLSVLLGNGDGTFAPAQNFPPGVPAGPGFVVQPLSIKVADFNGDGREDLATGNRTPGDPPIGSSVSILLGRGDGTFERAQEFATANGTTSLVVADFNNDGRPDLATSNHESSSVTILIAGPMNQQFAVTPPSSSSEGTNSGSSSGGGSFGSELWLLSAILLGRYARRQSQQQRRERAN